MLSPAVSKPHLSWKRTADEQPRGYIQAQHLREVWIHTGTACNLACPFCLEGSKPGDTRLQLVKFDDVRPFIDEAVVLGSEQISFTGGEPFLVRDLPRILGYATARLPCLVLTNGTKPLLKRMGQLEPLRNGKHPLSFRISLDYPDPKRHDNGRGAGSFAESLQSLVRLHDMGFSISVARQQPADEDSAAVTGAYRQLFREHGLPEDLPLIGFPDFHPPGSGVDTPDITEDCMTRYHTEESRDAFMCAYSRMVVKINGRMRVYACTLVDDDPDYDLGDTLTGSLTPRVMLRHHRCYSCFRFGASCSELK